MWKLIGRPFSWAEAHIGSQKRSVSMGSPNALGSWVNTSPRVPRPATRSISARVDARGSRTVGRPSRRGGRGRAARPVDEVVVVGLHAGQLQLLVVHVDDRLGVEDGDVRIEQLRVDAVAVHHCEPPVGVPGLRVGLGPAARVVRRVLVPAGHRRRDDRRRAPCRRWPRPPPGGPRPTHVRDPVAPAAAVSATSTGRAVRRRACRCR